MEDSLLYERRARICQVLADPTRLRLIDALRDGERSVGQLAEALGATYPNISQHLNVMRDTGLVTSGRDGTTIYHRLAYPQILQAVTLSTTCSVPSLSTRARWLAAEQPCRCIPHRGILRACHCSSTPAPTAGAPTSTSCGCQRPSASPAVPAVLRRVA
jgi:DNA-binding transcriptional ArsR family regulator